MGSLWYWGLFFVCAVVLLVAVPFCWFLEDRADERDRDLWDSLYGSRR